MRYGFGPAPGYINRGSQHAILPENLNIAGVNITLLLSAQDNFPVRYKKVNIMKIMAICGSGLGSSFMVEMNIKKVLKRINVEAEVEHADLSSATPGAADLFVMAKDIAASASVPEHQLLVINNIIDINELEAKLAAYFSDR